MRTRISLLTLLVIAAVLLAACSVATPAAPTTEPVITAAPPAESTAPAEESPTAEAGITAVPPAESTAEVNGSTTTAVIDQAAYNNLPDLGGRKIKAVTANDYVPLQFIDPKTGKAVGWEFDAVTEICRRLNCVPDWQVASWETMIPAIKGGQFDVGMDGITITEDRAKEVDFSAPYLRSEQYMLVRANEDRFTTPEEFKANAKLLIGSQAGTTNFYTAVYNVLDGNEANPRIILFDNFGASVQALLHGDVDMVLMDKASSAGYIGANPNQLKIVGEPLAGEDFGFIFTPGSDLVAPFNDAIDSLLQDGYLDYLSNRWFFLFDTSNRN